MRGVAIRCGRGQKAGGTTSGGGASRGRDLKWAWHLRMGRGQKAGVARSVGGTIGERGRKWAWY